MNVKKCDIRGYDITGCQLVPVTETCTAKWAEIVSFITCDRVQQSFCERKYKLCKMMGISKLRAIQLKIAKQFVDSVIIHHRLL